MNPMSPMNPIKHSDQTSQAIADHYDSVAYDSVAFTHSSPANIHGVATLFGLTPHALETARVLELGCAAGGNIIPLAARYPKAQFLGVDLSDNQIKHGKMLIKGLGLKNIRLQTRSITDVNDFDGKFDYIICHGVFSWVPAEVQAAIFKICQKNLSPNGLAYISYNTYPGWKGREIVRDAMLWRAQQGTTPQAKLSLAKGMVDFYAQYAIDGSVVKQEMIAQQGLMTTVGDYYLHHEFLELHNQPIYFQSFINKAREFNLNYLSEAVVSGIFLSNLSAELRATLMAECQNDQVKIEQHLDFLRNRTFRQTLLMPEAKNRNLNYNTPLEVWMSQHYEAKYSPTDDGVQFTSARGSAWLPQPWQRAVATALSQASPATVSAMELFSAAQAEFEDVTVNDVCQMLSQQVQCGVLRNSAVPVKCINKPSNKPCAEPFNLALAQWWAQWPERGTRNIPFTNNWHESCLFIAAYADLMAQCDGTKTATQLHNPNGLDLQLLYDKGLMVG
jgi:methyltransferase-like protein/2-polyprenyl-3-methyl-5-hydroxy-6-metoxy-1,4-benzoquinol methylase